MSGTVYKLLLIPVTSDVCNSLLATTDTIQMFGTVYQLPLTLFIQILGTFYQLPLLLFIPDVCYRVYQLHCLGLYLQL